MPDSREKKDFIKEKVIEPEKDKKQILRQIGKRVLGFSICGFVFGICAVLAALLLSPLLHHAYPKQTQEVVKIPKDAPDVQEGDETTSAKETSEPVADIVQSAIQQYRYSAEDFANMISSLSEIGSDLDKTIVSIQSVKNEKEWFDNTVPTTGVCSGIVIASTDSEYVILAPIKATGGADSIEVTFDNGVVSAATVKGVDKITGLSIVSVEKSNLEERTLQSVGAISLGNSNEVRRGQVIMSIGSPMGMVHSTSYGIVSYVARNMSVVDGTARFIYTDAKLDADSGTFIVNVKGELVGFAVKTSEKESNDSRRFVVYGISDFKNILERMSNAKTSPYIGIQGAEIPLNMREAGTPAGIYVTSCANDSPAYAAGIQVGDIITDVGSISVKNIGEYKKALEGLNVGESIPIKGRRSSVGKYKEVVFTVSVGAR